MKYTLPDESDLIKHKLKHVKHYSPIIFILITRQANQEFCALLHFIIYGTSRSALTFFKDMPTVF